MTDKIETKQGDVVVTATEATNLMFDVWAVSTDGQQEPTPGTCVSNAMGKDAATALAEQMARRIDGSVVQHNLEGGQAPAAKSIDGASQEKAKALMSKISNGRLTPEASAELENAIAQDLQAAQHQDASSEERLKKVEDQVQALSDAVVAFAAPSEVVDGAVKTVKDKM